MEDLSVGSIVPVLVPIGGKYRMLHGEHELSVFDKPCGDFLDKRFIVLDIVEGEGAEDDVKGCISKVQILHCRQMVGNLRMAVFPNGRTDHFF